MQLTIEDISPVEKRVDFEIPWADVVPRLEKAFNELRRDVKLKGFRPGKVPRSVLEKMFRPQVENDVARELIELSIARAVHENQIQPVAPPTIDKMELKPGEPFKFSALVEVRSQVEPKDYTGVELKRRPAQVKDEQIDAALETYRNRLTEYKPIEGRTTAADTDVLRVEVSGRVGEHKIKRREVMVDLEDEQGGPLPGLSVQLRGVALDAKDLQVKYAIAADVPQKELAGRNVDLKVSVKEAREKRRPALDDDMAKDTGEADTLDGLKQKIRERLLDSDKQRIQRELMQTMMKEIVKRNPFPIAPSLVDRFAEGMVARTRQQLAMLGIDAEGMDTEKMKQEVRGEAEEEAKATILLQAIAEREGIEASDADVKKRIAEIAAARNENPTKLRAELERDQRLHAFKQQIVEQQTMERLLSQAKVTDEEPGKLIVTPEEARAEANRPEGK